MHFISFHQWDLDTPLQFYANTPTASINVIKCKNIHSGKDSIMRIRNIDETDSIQFWIDKQLYECRR